MTWFLKIENGQPVGYPISQENMQYLFTNFNFNQAVTPEQIEPLGFAIYEFANQPVVSEMYKKVVETAPVLDNGIYKQTWQIVDMDEIERTQYNNNIAARVRTERNRLLISSDWSQVADAPITEVQREAYRVYRQSLRDLPSRAEFPFNVYRTATYDEYKTMFTDVMSCCQGADFLAYYRQFHNPNAEWEDVKDAYMLDKYQALLGTAAEPRVLDVVYPI